MRKIIPDDAIVFALLLNIWLEMNLAPLTLTIKDYWNDISAYNLVNFVLFFTVSTELCEVQLCEKKGLGTLRTNLASQRAIWIKILLIFFDLITQGINLILLLNFSFRELEGGIGEEGLWQPIFRRN